MWVQYEDKGHCLNCWQTASSDARGQTLQTSQQKRPKISLKRHNVHKPCHLPASLKMTAYPSTIETLRSTIYHPTENNNIMNLPHLQLDRSVPLKGGKVHRQVMHSDRTHPKRELYGYELPETLNALAERPESNRGERPAFKNRPVNSQEYMDKEGVPLAKRVIPKNVHTLSQIAKMKHSVLSILGPQEKAQTRIDESVIMIDFFSPNSKVTDGGHPLR